MRRRRVAKWEILVPKTRPDYRVVVLLPCPTIIYRRIPGGSGKQIRTSREYHTVPYSARKIATVDISTPPRVVVAVSHVRV